jgi:hypothetical protein
MPFQKCEILSVERFVLLFSQPAFANFCITLNHLGPRYLPACKIRAVETDGLRLQLPHIYFVTAPASFWWCYPYGATLEGKGITQEISQTGVLIATNECPPVGTPIQLTILLPGLRRDGQGIKLHGEGLILRVETYQSVNAEQMQRAFFASVHFYLESLGRPGKATRKNAGPPELSVQ